ncbi:MAG: transglycosylase domain-containing protein [Actinomycetota bacterium]
MGALRALAAVTAAVVAASGCSLPPVDLEETRPLALRSTITAADGTILARLFRQNRALVPIESIPDLLVDAVVAAEDARFFEHGGYDLKSMARAAIINWREGEIVQGGSTITQQYVKNTYFRDPPRTFKRKARELRLAIEVESQLSKREILERYLNTVYLGQGAYGAKAGAETYFGHGLSSLTLSEAATLAGVIKAPSRFDPRDHPKRGRIRRDYVLERMAELSFISRSEAVAAQQERLGIIPDPPRSSVREPYFVEAVKRELLSDKRLGPTGSERARALWKGGLRVETTLDRELQKAAESSVASVLGRPGDPEAALVAIAPKTGEIVAMVGGSDWSASQVNLALGKDGGGSGRQPGSSFKPIVATAALEAGIGLDTFYDSSPAVFTFPNAEPWTVRNSSEGTGGGSMPLDEALVHSVNGVFARLALQLGAGQIASQAQLMGVESKLPAYPSIALGSAEVSVVDMAAAYATLANGGTAVEPTTIKHVRTSDGTLLKPDQRVIPGVVTPGNAYLITKVLEQVIARGTGTAAQIDRPAAGKTGTTDDYADAWFVGYTPDLVTAVWVGYPQGRIPMTSVHGIRVAGGTFPALIWRAFMTEALRGEPRRNFVLPRSDLVTVEIDPKTGLLGASWCPGKKKTMLRQLVPTSTCPLPVPVSLPSPSPSPTPAPSPTKQPGKKKDGSGDPSPAPAPKLSPSPSPAP